MKGDQHIDKLFKQKLEHYEKQPATHNWDVIEQGMRGSGYGEYFARGFALLSLLAFLYVGYNSWISTTSNDTDTASMEEMIDYQLQKEAYELQGMHDVNESTAIASTDMIIAEKNMESIRSDSNPKPLKSQSTIDKIGEQPSPMSIAETSSKESLIQATMEDPSSLVISNSSLEINELEDQQEIESETISTTNIVLPVSSELLIAEPSSESLTSTLTLKNQHIENQYVINELISLYLLGNQMVEEADLYERDYLVSHVVTKRGFYTGTIGSGHNSWILNNKAEEASAAENLDYKLDFGVAYGLIAGYDFSKHWGVEAEWIINSKQGQKYENNYLSTGIVSEEEVDLNYMHFPVFIKYKNNQYSTLFRAPRTINVLFGPQYSVVQESTTSFNNGLVVIEELVNTKEFGMSLGLEYNVSIKNNLDVGLGARSSISTDINMFPRPFSKDLEKSNNLLIGVNAGIRYYPFH